MKNIEILDVIGQDGPMSKKKTKSKTYRHPVALASLIEEAASKLGMSEAEVANGCIAEGITKFVRDTVRRRREALSDAMVKGFEETTTKVRRAMGGNKHHPT